jgi:hypothetical protein
LSLLSCFYGALQTSILWEVAKQHLHAGVTIVSNLKQGFFQLANASVTRMRRLVTKNSTTAAQLLLMTEEISALITVTTTTTESLVFAQTSTTLLISPTTGATVRPPTRSLVHVTLMEQMPTLPFTH